MRRADDEPRVKQIAVGAGVLGVLALTVCGAMLGWRCLPGLLGEWLGTLVGVLTTPFLFEASWVLIGLTVVLVINHWRLQRAGAEWVDLDEAAASAVPRGPSRPAQELRFTRSGQAVLFWVLAAVLAAVAVTLAATSIYRDSNPQLPHPAWALVPLSLAVLAARLAAHLTRHAYLILTPLGIEIFPFFRPAAGMRLVVWQEVAAAEVNPAATLLTLHHDAAKTAGIHLSLKPIRADRRSFAAQAVIGRIGGG
jgi:hypothetical protein